ncbi:unnamed protein product [Bemisia tabaci]|uniref:Toll-interacting protein n=1 Tax=Bemisia tabaci TaxID=7038 RepID=A0A9P0F3W4_BEMTA|nr:PREDICTED: toll-interacting protein-like [Bemisia tabaci]CAH0387075.1 unnamed protein product [Bemisia tabaci]
MAATASPESINAERRKRVFVGELPQDFLRITVSPQQQQEAADQQTALAIQQQLSQSLANGFVGRLNITVAHAKLTKNYGMMRMDPYVRLRVGHCVYETHTDPHGGKNPRWNKVVQCFLQPGVNSISLEIYDECSFTMDELVAWAHIPIPEKVFEGVTVENWFPLSGKQGDDAEGAIYLVLSYSNAPTVNPYFYGAGAVPPVMMVPSTNQTMFGMRSYAPMPVYSQPSQQNQAQPLNEETLKQIEEMFPNMDKEVIKSVFEFNRGNKDTTVNAILQMAE